jgi:hypothetical protein
MMPEKYFDMEQIALVVKWEKGESLTLKELALIPRKFWDIYPHNI